MHTYVYSYLIVKHVTMRRYYMGTYISSTHMYNNDIMNQACLTITEIQRTYYMHIYMYISTLAAVLYAYIYVYMYIYICIYIYIYM